MQVYQAGPKAQQIAALSASGLHAGGYEKVDPLLSPGGGFGGGFGGGPHSEGPRGVSGFTFRPAECICLPGCRTTKIVFDPVGATLSSEGSNSCAAHAFERTTWRDVVLLRGSLGARSTATLVVALVLSLLTGVLSLLTGVLGGYGGTSLSSASAIGLALLVLLLFIVYWLFDRKGAFGVFAAAPGELAPPPSGLPTAPGNVEPAVGAGVRAWFAVRGGPAGDPYNAPSAEAKPQATALLQWCGCLCPKGEERLEGRPAGAAGGGAAFFTHKSLGLCNLPLLSSQETTAFLAKDVQYLHVVSGGRTLSVFCLGLALLVGGIALSEALKKNCGVSCVGTTVGEISTALALLGVAVLVWWWAMKRVELTFGLTEALAPSVQVPPGREEALWREAFTVMLGKRADEGVGPGAVSLEGVDQFGSLVTLQVDAQLTRVKTYQGTRDQCQRLLCAACTTTETFACRTASLQFVSASTTDLQSAIISTIATAVLLVTILMELRRIVPGYTYILYSILAGAVINLVYKYLTCVCCL